LQPTATSDCEFRASKLLLQKSPKSTNEFVAAVGGFAL